MSMPDPRPHRAPRLLVLPSVALAAACGGGGATAGPAPVPAGSAATASAATAPAATAPAPGSQAKGGQAATHPPCAALLPAAEVTTRLAALLPGYAAPTVREVANESGRLACSVRITVTAPTAAPELRLIVQGIGVTGSPADHDAQLRSFQRRQGRIVAEGPTADDADGGTLSAAEGTGGSAYWVDRAETSKIGTDLGVRTDLHVLRDTAPYELDVRVARGITKDPADPFRDQGLRHRVALAVQSLAEAGLHP